MNPETCPLSSLSVRVGGRIKEKYMGWGAIASAAATGIGGIASTVGQHEANMMNLDMAKHKYRYAAEDMKGAGINPMMAGLGGTTPAPMPEMKNAMEPLGKSMGEAAEAAVNAEKTVAETTGIKAENAWIERNNEANLDYISTQAQKLGVDMDEGMQRIAESMSRQQEISSNIALNEARRMLDEAKTATELEEAIKVSKASELITAQIQTELQKLGINEQQYLLLFEDTERARQMGQLLAQQLKMATIQTDMAEINAKWLEETIIQALTNRQVQAISQMIGSVGGTITGGAGGVNAMLGSIRGGR